MENLRLVKDECIQAQIALSHHPNRLYNDVYAKYSTIFLFLSGFYTTFVRQITLE
jgi:hypothetical protein